MLPLQENHVNQARPVINRDDQAVLACYLPGTADDRPGYSPSRRAAFDRIEARHRGAPWRRVSEGSS